MSNEAFTGSGCTTEAGSFLFFIQSMSVCHLSRIDLFYVCAKWRLRSQSVEFSGQVTGSKSPNAVTSQLWE